MKGNVDRLLEAIRQRALVRSGRLYGQVECRAKWHGLTVSLALQCSQCGAVL